MLIRELKLTNFGIYGGEHSFDLRPVPSDRFNRPIILVTGKNGVGKTTFVEAIRLCLHGQAALGDRIGQREYDSYLLSRIHRPNNKAGSLTESEIALEFDYVGRGKKQSFKVIRHWKQQNNRVLKELFVWENEKLLSESDEQKEELLRELVPPGIADLFFFDGEKIHTLADDEKGNVLLSDTVKALLGLNMVEQLEKDLDLFITRQQMENGHAGLILEIDNFREKEDELEREIANLQISQREISNRISLFKQQVEHQEQKIAMEGGSFSRLKDEHQLQLERVDANIDLTKRQIQELCGTLMPFAIIPEMLKVVADQLEKERQYHAWQVAEEVLSQQLSKLKDDITQPGFWDGFPLIPESLERENLLIKIQNSLRHTLPERPMNDEEVILQVSDKERDALLGWIEKALDSTPHQLCELIKTLNHLQDEQKRIRATLDKVPEKETLRPLILELQNLTKQLVELEKEQDTLAEKERIATFHLERVNSQLRHLHEQVAAHTASDERVRLAARTQLALETFAENLTKEKVRRLEVEIVRRFNRLSRKENFIESARVHPNHFTLTLYRNGRVFSRSELSAGERQLLAIATLWALREVSGRPTPVIIDTPLSRLDSEHRLTMIQEYFPWVSHQVIILATDVEIDKHVKERLRPAISHVYHLADDINGSIKVEMERLEPKMNIIEAERIPIL